MMALEDRMHTPCIDCGGDTGPDPAVERCSPCWRAVDNDSDLSNMRTRHQCRLLKSQPGGDARVWLVMRRMRRYHQLRRLAHRLRNRPWNRNR